MKFGELAGKLLQKARAPFKSLKNRIIAGVILGLLLIIAILLIYMRIKMPPEPKSTTTLSSALFDALDIDELSGSSFIYNGIAEIPNPKKPEKVLYNASYNATVKAGIQLHDIDIQTDDEQKIVTITLPEVFIQSVAVNPSKFDFLPDNAKIDLKAVLSACKEDADREASESSELIDAARENLSSMVEALAMPIIDGSGYTLVMQGGAAK